MTWFRQRPDPQLADALRDLQAAIEEQTKFAKSVAATGNVQVTRTLSDMMSGHIAGHGVTGRKFKPGEGTDVAY